MEIGEPDNVVSRDKKTGRVLPKEHRGRLRTEKRRLTSA
jgi:hypothetical protein